MCIYKDFTYILDLCANDIDLDLMKKGVVFLHGVALDNTRLGKWLNTFNVYF